MKKMKLLFQQALMISVGILFAIGVDGAVNKIRGQEEAVWLWYTPFAVILTGFLCALPTFIFWIPKTWGKADFPIRIGIHFLILFGMVSLAGYFFGWYRYIGEYLFVMTAYVVIYLLVWIGSVLLMRHDENCINKRLESIRDEE